MTESSLWSLLLVMIIAAVAPIISRLIPGRPPQVLFLIIGGVLIGPHVLGFADSGDIELVAGLGLGFLFLLAGYELEPALLREKAGRQALIGWVISAVAAVLIVGGLEYLGFVRAFVPVSIALTTTALGTLLPILREQHMLTGTFGRYIFAAGAVGELFPILATSLLLGAYRTWSEALIIASIGGLAYLLVWLTRLISGTRVAAIITENRHATSQTTLRITVVLLVGLLLDHAAVRGRGRARRVLRRHGAARAPPPGTAANWTRNSTPSGTASSSPSSSSAPGWPWTCCPSWRTRRGCWSSSCCCSGCGGCPRCWSTGKPCPPGNGCRWCS